MATAGDLRRGMAINYNGDIAVVLDMQHRTPGNLRAFAPSGCAILPDSFLHRVPYFRGIEPSGQ